LPLEKLFQNQVSAGAQSHAIRGSGMFRGLPDGQTPPPDDISPVLKQVPSALELSVIASTGTGPVGGWADGDAF
jgi:hypothetical protein